MAPTLLWINGPFGGGKTQTAFELHRRLPGSEVADPEHLGFGLRRMLPRAVRGDFQDFPAWRHGVREVLDHLLRTYEGTDKTIIAPMTVVVPAYFDEIIGKLRADGHTVHHFALLAREDTVRRRLRRRVTPLIHGDSWALKQVERCLTALRRPEFAHHVHTDDRTVAQVADEVARHTGLDLRPDTTGSLRANLRQTWVSVKHIRVG
ncbi:AAA family ATPase [Amycolatopsis sp. NPDC059027]|uniref:AAA family ATPase n=1 Tax=unclassified Amycolatopsis TaxID=2618356 RepID=UPI00366C9F58